MTTRRRVVLVLLASACCALGLVTAPTGAAATAPAAEPASPALHRAHPATPAERAPAAGTRVGEVAVASRGALPHVAGCDGDINLGDTNQCDFTEAGTAVYSVEVSGPDVLRVRAAQPTYTGSYPTVVVRGDSPLCTQSVPAQFACAVPSAGTYTIEVSSPQPVTIYTTVNSVRNPVGCGADLALGTTAPGASIAITDPGASYCAPVSGVVAGDVVRFAFHSTADDPLHVTIYNDAGESQCEVAPLFTAAECTVGPGSGFRLFANWEYEYPRSTVLYATRLTRPAGCQAAAPDAFGTAPSRSAAVAEFRVRCFTTTVDANHPLAVHVVAAVPTRVLPWSVRTPAGVASCTGTTTSGTMSCPAPVSGQYALFVAGPTGSSGGPTTTVTATMAAPLDSAGCTPLTSTAFGAAPELGTVSPAGEIDCWTFAGSAGHVMQTTAADVTRHLGVMLVDPNGNSVCRFQNRTSCRLPELSGTYRVLVWGDGTTDPVDYRLWVTDRNSTAGCTPTTADAFGVAPDRSGPIDDTAVNQCWAFSAEDGQSYLVSLTTASGALFGRLRVSQLRGPVSCEVTTFTRGGCRITRTGKYLMVAERYSDGWDPTQQAVVRAGLWRLDQPSGCRTARLSFGAPAIDESFTGPDEVDCALVTTPGSEVFTVNAGGPPDLSVQHQLYALNGRRKCTAYPGGHCRVRRAGTYVMITYSLQHQVVSYTMSVRSVTQHRGCAAAGLGEYGARPTETFDIVPGAPACVTFTRSATAGPGILRVGGDPTNTVHFTLFGSTRNQVCSGAAGLRVCRLTGTGPFVLEVHGSQPTTASAALYSAYESNGCTATPTFAFDVPPERGLIRWPSQVDCVDLGTSSAPRVLRLAVGRAPEGSVLHLAVFDTLGRQRCASSTTDYFRALSCSLRKNTHMRLLIWLEDGQSASTGRYAVHIWELVHPLGCTQLGPAGNGFGPVLGQFADPNDQDCYQFTAAAGTTLQITVDDPDVPSTLPPWVDVRRPDGRFVCEIVNTGTCTLPEKTKYTMIVFPRSGQPDYVDRYRVVATPA